MKYYNTKSLLKKIQIETMEVTNEIIDQETLIYPNATSTLSKQETVKTNSVDEKQILEKVIVYSLKKYSF